MKKTWVVGDVHGAGGELSSLINMMKLSEGDELILVGDLFDRGQHADLVWRAIEATKAKCLMGNHERKMLSYLKGERNDLPKHYYYALDVLINKHKLCSKESLVEFLEKLPIIYVKDNHIIAHGGVNPYNPTEPNVSYNVYGNHEKGTSIPIGDKFLPRDMVWWELYQGDNIVVYGHTVCDKNLPRIHKNLKGRINSIGIDTACVHGGPLTCYCLEDMTFLQFKSGINYYQKIKEKNIPKFELQKENV